SWQILMEYGWKPTGGFKALCGGEAMPKSLCDALLESGVELWNMYGPTETCVWSCVQKMELSQSKILIGRPVANTQIYITDEHLQPMPVGVPGDLWIGGDGLALEYLNRPELTAEKFSANPFSNEEGTLIYKTGDLARYLPDGSIECLGRSDFQMKLRGYRIEPGEIEAKLCEYTGVEQAVVCIKQFSEGDMRLVAYVISSKSLKENLTDIQAYLRKHLPDYMVPSAIMEMEEYPLTPNGKIDRKALPLPGFNQTREKVVKEQPTDELEEALLDIWESVLMNKSIGIHDNFFQIGGHSLLAARIFARIEQQLGKRLPLATLFNVQTIAGLANFIREEKEADDWRSLVAIRSAGSRKPLFLIHGAGGNVLLYRDLAKYLNEDQPVYGLQAQGLDGSMNYLTRFEDMAERYIREIREVQPRGPYYLGGYCLGGTIAYEIARQLDAIGEKVALVAMFETFNIQTLDKKYYSGKYEIVYKLQNWMFHLRNLLSVDGRERNRFFLEKARVERSRAKAALQVSFSRFKTKLNGEGQVEDKKAPVILDPINDEAQAHYFPQPYSGRITLFRPEKHFLGFGDKHSGWSGLAEGGINLQHMPLCPRGMMVEPFVQILAEKLENCIESTVDMKQESAIKF
ncbi:MAG: alpha/beta fold hydrolase, partial [Calditrichota bacterium]